MKDRRDIKLDVVECREKIDAILREYNCRIEFDLELMSVILVDIDTMKFEYIAKKED